MRILIPFIALTTLLTACKKEQDAFVEPVSTANTSIHYSQSSSDPLAYYFVFRSDPNDPQNKHFRWTINGQPLNMSEDQFQHKFSQPGTYVITASSEEKGSQVSLTFYAGQAY